MIGVLLACTSPSTSPKESQTLNPDTAGQDSFVDSVPEDSSLDTAASGDPFADALVSFVPGEGAGYGQDQLPDVVLGGPEVPGTGGGSLDVLSLGREGEIILQFTDSVMVDGEGPDLLIFENPFTGWYEPGRVAVSMDGTTWYEWPCEAENAEAGFPGCAGVAIVYANSTNGVDPTDPTTAGGDAFDLGTLDADLGAGVSFVRVRDAGVSDYGGTAGGFDLDAIAIVNRGKVGK